MASSNLYFQELRIGLDGYTRYSKYQKVRTNLVLMLKKTSDYIAFIIKAQGLTAKMIKVL